MNDNETERLIDMATEAADNDQYARAKSMALIAIARELKRANDLNELEQERRETGR